MSDETYPNIHNAINLASVDHVTVCCDYYKYADLYLPVFCVTKPFKEWQVKIKSL